MADVVSANHFPKVILEERLADGSDTDAPAADHRALILGEDGALHLKDSAGTVTDVGGTETLPESIIDAAGDLIVGDGADSAARLALGTAGQVLTVNAGATAPEWATSSGAAAFYGCRVYNSANISIPNASATALTFNSERFDDASAPLHSTVSNTGRITNASGEALKFHIGGGVSFAADPDGNREVLIRLNGATYIARNASKATDSGAHQMTIDTIYELAAGDYVELVVVQSAGASLNVTLLANASPEFWAYKLG